MKLTILLYSGTLVTWVSMIKMLKGLKYKIKNDFYNQYLLFILHAKERWLSSKSFNIYTQ